MPRTASVGAGVTVADLPKPSCSRSKTVHGLLQYKFDRPLLVGRADEVAFGQIDVSGCIALSDYARNPRYVANREGWNNSWQRLNIPNCDRVDGVGSGSALSRVD
jgi:hypothetical protein